MDSRELYERHPSSEASALIPFLQDLQELYGYLPEDEMRKVANHLRLPFSRVYGVATFYNQFRLQPLGKYVIKVCRGTACHVKGSFDLLTTLENELGIKAGETTKDLKFTIETVACIGACSMAPVIAINDEFYGGLTVKSLQKLLKTIDKNGEKE